MNNLIKLIYRSKATISLDHTMLDNLKNISRFNNMIDQITGLLIYSEPYFFQVLEGNKELVERTFEKIKGDKLHNDIELLEIQSINTRNFAKWGMGLAIIDNSTNINNQLEEYFDKHFDPLQISKTESKYLFEVFSNSIFETYIQ